MRYGSVCSGIEAATVAWAPLGWQCQFVSEIEPFPCAALSHHYPDVPNLGDMTNYQEWPDHDIDVLVGGTPCQSFSVAGLRLGLADPRGNLALTYLGVVDRYRPEYVVWENVPGVLSSHGGRDFGSFLGALAKLGYGWAYRVLDAQFFGVAQRRRRVFVVGCLGDGARAAAILFDGESLSGNPPPRGETREGAAGGVTHSLRGEGFDASEDGTGRGTPIIPLTSVCSPLDTNCGDPTRTDTWGAITVHPTQDPIHASEVCHSQGANATAAVALHENQRGEVSLSDTTSALSGGGGKPGQGYPAVAVGVTLHGADGTKSTASYTDTSHSLRARNPTQMENSTCTAVQHGMSVRRLTPRECERLQGFPDDYTLIPYRNKPADKCPDGPRYKALGNSMAVPVMRWIGGRIQQERAA